MFVGMMGVGGAATRVQLESDGYGDVAGSPANANEIFVFKGDGTLTDNGDVVQTWLVNGAASEFEVMVSNAGPDTLLSGSLDTWLAADVDRTYQLQNTADGDSTKTAALTVQIRDAGSGQVLASATITLSATVFL